MIEFLAAHPALAAGVVAAGFAAGFAGGLFGIGGGVITVPALYAVFQSLGFGEDASLKTAIGTSLSVIIVSSVRSLMTHHRAGHVDAAMLRAWAPWIAIGACSGGLLAKWAPAELLTAIFVGGAVYIAWRRIVHRGGARAGPPIDLYRKRMKLPLGLGAGVFSSLMGLGGGAVGVMVMTLAGRPMHQAVATSAGFGIAVAIPGAGGFVYSGWSAAGLPPGALGFVNVPAFLAMALAAAVAAPLGARLAHRMDGDLLSKIFGAYVLIAAAALAIDVFGA